MQEGVPRSGERSQDRPQPTPPRARPARRRRRADGDAARPAGALDARPSLNTLAAITDRKAGFRSLGDVWADTTTAHGRLMLTALGGLAEFERELIRAWTAEGRAWAKANGKSLGRPFKLTEHQRREAIKRRESGELLTEIARSYNVSAATISRLRT